MTLSIFSPCLLLYIQMIELLLNWPMRYEQTNNLKRSGRVPHVMVEDVTFALKHPGLEATVGTNSQHENNFDLVNSIHSRWLIHYSPRVENMDGVDGAEWSTSVKFARFLVQCYVLFIIFPNFR